MKTLQTSLLSAVLCLAAASVLPAQIPVRVIGDRVNLRAKPQLTSEVVTQANYDDQLIAREIGDEWVEVAAPASVNLWISKKFVQQQQNTVGAKRVNVRAGPSINYNIVDTLSLGDTIEPRGEEVQEWLKIAPPPTAHVWIHREFVEIPSDVQFARKSAKKTEKELKKAKKDEKSAKRAKKSTKKKKKRKKVKETAVEEAGDALGAVIPTPIVSPSTPVEDSSARSIPVPPPANLKLIPLEGQGRLTEVEGELRAAPLLNEAPCRYRVVSWQNNRWKILCHVYGQASKFRSLQNKRVRLKGRQYWIQGSAAPVLIPDQVREIKTED